jgi:hypothetical protein
VKDYFNSLSNGFVLDDAISCSLLCLCDSNDFQSVLATFCDPGKDHEENSWLKLYTFSTHKRKLLFLFMIRVYDYGSYVRVRQHPSKIPGVWVVAESENRFTLRSVFYTSTRISFSCRTIL